MVRSINNALQIYSPTLLVSTKPQKIDEHCAFIDYLPLPSEVMICHGYIKVPEHSPELF